jgi:putative membrane protein
MWTLDDLFMTSRPTTTRTDSRTARGGRSPPPFSYSRPVTDRPPRDLDYRFTLANERTFLAWLRTSLALVAAGVAVVQLVPEFGLAGARHVVGVVLAGLGILVAAGSIGRWRRVQEAMERDQELPRARMPLLLGSALAVLGVAVAVLLVVSGPA